MDNARPGLSHAAQAVFRGRRGFGSRVGLDHLLQGGFGRLGVFQLQVAVGNGQESFGCAGVVGRRLSKRW